MKAHQLFKKNFTTENLFTTYWDKVSYKAGVGVDGINRNRFEKELSYQFEIITRKVRTGTYHFSPYRAALIPRTAEKKPRKIERPTIRDKLVLRVLFEILNDVFGDYLENRKLHSQIKSVNSMMGSGRYTRLIRLDVKDFYPSILHEKLISMVKLRIRKFQIVNLIDKAIKNCSDIDKRRGNAVNEKGVPQGLSISNVLANIYLAKVDAKYDVDPRMEYYRYVDDILILCGDEEHEDIKSEIKKDLKKIGLDIHTEDKFLDADIDREFSYLGYSFVGGIVSVRKASITKIRMSIMKILSSYKYAKNRSSTILEFKLNLRITGCIFEGKKYGWLFYFSQINDEGMLHALDGFVNKQLNKRVVDVVKVKKFVKCWKEITKNFSGSDYFPNFDAWENQRKMELLNAAKIKNVTYGNLSLLFKRFIHREIIELERDMAEVS